MAKQTMGKDANGVFHPGKGKPSGVNKEEGLGLQNTPKDLHPTALRIPIHPRLESLNAAVALSLALYEYRRAHPQNIF